MERMSTSYKRWVRKHAEVLSVIDTALATVTWLLPNRFSENEFTLEGIHTVANLISVFHESILNEANDRAPAGAQELTLALNALQQVEVLVELYALHSRKDINRYDALLIVESLKALVRLAIYRVSDRRLLLHGGAEGMFDQKTTTSSSSSFRRLSKANTVLRAFQAFRESRQPPVSDEVLRQIESRVEQTNCMAYKLLFAGEMCHVLRPVVYVASLRIWGLKSWKPWLISLAVELLSAEATRSAWTSSNDVALGAARDLTSSTGSGIAGLYAKQGIRWGPRDLDEITRRKLLLMYYLLRDPLFGRTTRPALQACVRATSRIPLLSSLISLPVSLVEGIQRYYSYTSAA